MNKQYIVQPKINGLYFVKGQGYDSTRKSDADLLTNVEIEAIRIAGFEPFDKHEVVISYAVMYVRPKDVLSDGSVAANRDNPSRRRFATIDEANEHGSRFNKRKAKGSKVEGSAGHIGFFVVKTNDPVNASVNWDTGLTNPL